MKRICIGNQWIKTLINRQFDPTNLLYSLLSKILYHIGFFF